VTLLSEGYKSIGKTSEKVLHLFFFFLRGELMPLARLASSFSQCTDAPMHHKNLYRQNKSEGSPSFFFFFVCELCHWRRRSNAPHRVCDKSIGIKTREKVGISTTNNKQLPHTSMMHYLYIHLRSLLSI
jgi:hypothetical protein